MFSFDVNKIDDTYLRPCVCVDENKNICKSFCYVEGTDLDKTRSDNKEELGENVWYEAKPPKLFTKDIPLITARQIEISRIILSGTRTTTTAAQEDDKPREKATVNMKKKRSAVKFLSTTEIVLD